KLTGKSNNLRSGVSERSSSLAPSLTLPLALASCCEFRNSTRLLELSDGSKHLPHQNGGRGFLREKNWSGRGNDREPESLEHIVTGELGREGTSEAGGRFHADGFLSGRPEGFAQLC